ncbi:unnamed protein product [Larinioides sclopetarius]|uniref:Mab-21-like nucleotidyltransferase domain-containing protein n=1 Tax=Larinioides sclopetarius TaxID=280406 RepID=A0AAV1ZHW4_9ARAC
MSFKTQKILLCALCEKIISVEEEGFPEDLHALLSKYCIPQLYWLCKSCEKQNAFKSSFRKESNLEDEIKLLKAKVESLEIEMTEIKKLVALKARDYNSSFLSSSGFSGESSLDMGFPNADGNSCISFRNYRNVDCHRSTSEGCQGDSSCSSSASSYFQTVGSSSSLVSEDDQRLDFSVIPVNQAVDNHSPLTATRSCIEIPDSCNISLGSDETSPKKKKEAHALIHQISNTKIKIDDKESTKSSNIVDAFLKCITRFLKKKDVIFNNLYSRDYRTGSSYNDLRISAASEYDVDIVFKAPSEIKLEVEFFRETMAYAKIKWQKVGDILDSKIDILRFFEKNSLDRYLQPLKISAWFQGLIDSFMLSSPEISGIKQLKNGQSGPARTIEIVTDEDYILHIDLVPVFVFSYESLKTTKIKEILEKYSVAESKRFWFLVPKQCQGEGQLLASDCKLSWRVDFPEVEKKVLHNKQSAKHVIRLLKALKFLQECVKNQRLPYFMDPSYNLFHALNKDECKNLSNRLQRIITSIESDHNNLSYIYS